MIKKIMTSSSKVSIALMLVLQTGFMNYAKGAELDCFKTKQGENMLLTESQCNEPSKTIIDFENSFDYQGLTLIERVHWKHNLMDLLGLGPNWFPENRMVYESKQLWKNFENKLKEHSSNKKKYTQDIFNGFDSSLSQLK
tara:strand:+ start:4834 stop:5253 length:420 start_codon:yes stop_codon:yes gene_type:complete